MQNIVSATASFDQFNTYSIIICLFTLYEFHRVCNINGLLDESDT